MSAAIIPFPARGRFEDRLPVVRVHIGISAAGEEEAVVTIAPCPPGCCPRRVFSDVEEAGSYADGLARTHCLHRSADGSTSHSVTTLGPEEVA